MSELMKLSKVFPQVAIPELHWHECNRLRRASSQVSSRREVSYMLCVAKVLWQVPHFYSPFGTRDMKSKAEWRSSTPQQAYQAPSPAYWHLVSRRWTALPVGIPFGSCCTSVTTNASIKLGRSGWQWMYVVLCTAAQSLTEMCPDSSSKVSCLWLYPL